LWDGGGNWRMGEYIFALGVGLLGTAVGAYLGTHEKASVRVGGFLLMMASLPCFFIWLYMSSPLGPPPGGDSTATEMEGTK
jgi:hypothetical protein